MQALPKLLITAIVWLLLWLDCGLLTDALAQEDEKKAVEAEVARGENYVVYACRKTELQDILLGSSVRTSGQSTPQTPFEHVFQQTSRQLWHGRFLRL